MPALKPDHDHEDCISNTTFSLSPEQSQKVLEAMLEISNLVGSDHAIDRILDKIVRITARTMAVETSSIYLWNEAKTRVVLHASSGLEPHLIGVAGFDAGEGVPGWVAKEGKILALADGTKDPRYAPLPTTLAHDYHAYLCAPLRIQEEVIGVMTIRKAVVQEFTETEITIYETICKQVALVIEKARMQNAQLEAEKLAAVAVSLSGVAHYIKNVLMAVKGGEYLLDIGFKRGDLHQSAEGWKVLKRQISKISGLVENMLNYYRSTGVHPRPVEINTFILEILENLEDRAIDKNTVLTPDLDLRLELVELDPDALQDVLMNLVINAIDAIPKGEKGIVRVRTRLDEERGEVQIGVIDNGMGIPEEHRAKLFNLFFTTKGKEGTGIGLAASRRLILEHGGTIEYQTESGEGTEFDVRLPLRQRKV